MYQLGNLISFHSTNDVDIVKKIEKKGKKIYINDVSIGDIKPIHITPKILENFGFKFNSFQEHWVFVIDNTDEIVVMFYKKDGAFFLSHFRHNSEVEIPVLSYAHQFQNYFSLCFDILL